MTTVGEARVVISADAAAFGREAKAEVVAAIKQLGPATQQSLDALTPIFARAGTASGEAFAQAATKAALAGMKQLGVAQEELATSTRTSTRAQQSDTAATDANAAAKKRLADLIADLAAVSTKEQQATLRAAAANARVTAAYAEAGSAAQLEAREVARLASVQATAIGAARSMAAAQTEAAAASAKSSSGLALLAKSAGELGLIVGAFEAVKQVIDIGKETVSFQRSMLLIQTQAGASAATVKTLSAAALAMSGSVATSPDKLATALYHIVSASQGLQSTSKDLEELRIAAEGAKVGNADLEETTNALTATVASGISGVQNMAQAMGALNAIVGGGDMHLSDLNEALGSGILVTAKQFGLSLTDVGAALDVFGDNNIRGAKAATSLRLSVEAMASPLGKGIATLKSLGLSSTDLATDMQKGGLNAALVDLSNHLKTAHIQGDELGAVLTDAFGRKAGPGIAILVDQLDRFQIKMGVINAGAGGFGAAWQATTKTVAFQFQSLADSAKAVGIKILSNLLPDGSAFASGFAKLLSAVGPMLTGLEPIIAAIGTGLKVAGELAGAIGAVLGPIAPIVGHVAEVVIAMWAAFKGYQIAVLAVGAISDIFGAVVVRAASGAAAVQAFGTSFGGAATESVASAATIATAAEGASDAVVVAGAEAEVGWAGVAGPIALAAVGIAAVISLFHSSSSASKEAAAAAKSYSDAISQAGSSFNLGNTITEQLAKTGAADDIETLNKSLGRTVISGKEYVGAIEGSTASTKKLSIALTALGLGGTAKQKKAAQDLLAIYTSQTAGLSTAVKKDLEVTKVLSGVSSSIDKTTQSTKVGSQVAAQYATMMGITVDKNGVAAASAKDLNAAVNTVATAYDTADSAAAGYLAALNTFSTSAGTAADRAALIGATLKAANGDALDFSAAMNAGATSVSQLKSDMASAASSVGKGGESIKAFIGSIVNLKAGTIDYSKAAAAPLISDLQSMQTAAMNAAQAEYQHEVAIKGGRAAAGDAYNTYKQLTDGALVDNAKQLGLTADQAKKLATQYFGMPKSVKTQIEQEGADPVVRVLNEIGSQLSILTGHKWVPTVGILDHASAAAKHIQQVIDGLHGKTITVTTITSTGTIRPGSGPVTGIATGGTIVGRAVRLAGGGSADGPSGTVRGPGTGTSDTAGLFALSNGEEVVRASQAEKHRALIKAINAGTMGFASGGTVPGVTHVGKNWVYGGIDYASQRAADNAATRAAKAAVTAQQKLIIKIDGSDMEKITKALSGTIDSLKAAFQTLFADAKKAGLDPAKLRVLQQASSADIAKLAATQKATSKLQAELGAPSTAGTTAYDKLAADQQTFADEAKTVTDAFTNGFNIFTAGQQSTGTGGASGPSQAFMAAMARYQSGRQQVGDDAILGGGDGTDSSSTTPAFSVDTAIANGAAQIALEKKVKAELADLQRKGISKALYAQLAEGGVADADQIAALDAASKSQIATLSAQFATIGSIGGAAGQAAAQVIDGAAVTHDEGVIKAIKQQIAEYKKLQLEEIAAVKALAAQIAGHLDKTAAKGKLHGRTTPVGKK